MAPALFGRLGGVALRWPSPPVAPSGGAVILTTFRSLLAEMKIALLDEM